MQQIRHFGEMDVDASTPFISVAIPTYRRPEGLNRALTSILSQCYANWEIIVSDDEGPQGAGWALVAERARSDPRIRIVANAGARGQVQNTNNALLHCSGEWIKILHDDDWLAPGALERFAQVARRWPSASFISCAVNEVTEGGSRPIGDLNRRCEVSVYTPQQTLIDLYLTRRTRAIGMVPSTLLVRRDVVETGCLMRTYRAITEGVDQLFFIDLACRGDMVIINEALIFYDATQHDSIGNKKTFQKADQETIDLKQLIWSLIENRRHLPPPETVVRALRVARIPRRFRRQPFATTVSDALCLFAPSVMKLALQSAIAHRRASDF